MIGWIAVILSIVGIILNAKHKMSCWPVWIASNVFWVIHAIDGVDIPAVVLWFVFMGFNVYGWYQWRRDAQKPRYCRCGHSLMLHQETACEYFGCHCIQFQERPQ